MPLKDVPPFPSSSPLTLTPVVYNLGVPCPLYNCSLKGCFLGVRSNRQLRIVRIGPESLRWFGAVRLSLPLFKGELKCPNSISTLQKALRPTPLTPRSPLSPYAPLAASLAGSKAAISQLVTILNSTSTPSNPPSPPAPSLRWWSRLVISGYFQKSNESLHLKSYTALRS